MITIASNADQVALHLDGIAAGLPALLTGTQRGAGDKIGTALQNPIALRTPVITGALRQSTTYTLSLGEETTVEMRQTATNKQGTQYAGFVVRGHRIVAWGHDTGRMQPPNPYPTDAWDASQSVVLGILAAESTAGMRLLAVRP